MAARCFRFFTERRRRIALVRKGVSNMDSRLYDNMIAWKNEDLRKSGGANAYLYEIVCHDTDRRGVRRKQCLKVYDLAAGSHPLLRDMFGFILGSGTVEVKARIAVGQNRRGLSRRRD